MCGIFCILAPNYEYNQEIFNETFKKCETNLKRRGPDFNSTSEISLKDWKLLLNCSVLWLQGEQIIKQPIETEKSWFLYNGDVFGEEIITFNLRSINGDSKLLLNFIENNSENFQMLSKIQGPKAFIFIDKVKNKLYFGRDSYGRRSLLIGRNNNKFIITSVGCKNINFSLIELPALGIYCIDLNLNYFNLELKPWNKINQQVYNKFKDLQVHLNYEISVESNISSDKLELLKCPDEFETLLRGIETLEESQTFSLLQSNPKWNKNLLKLQKLLENSLEQRIKNQPSFCNNCIQQKLSCDHCTIGILFSGGVDCAILTLLADKFVEKHRPIDLMNVAFEKNNNCYETPDRLTAIQTLEELKNLRPDRRWNLLEINITKDELNKERKEKICHLIYPLNSILDESLGCALWFAARGETDINFKYKTPCRVLLVGMGADELFGGYTRHRAAFKRGKWQELSKELDNDWKNISHRNLARDDRIISDHGRQLRTPYLDENLVEFLLKLNPWEKCYPSESVRQGLGEKLLLRNLAYKLGLKKAALLKKRALQFGSRIANSKENAHDVSPRLI